MPQSDVNLERPDHRVVSDAVIKKGSKSNAQVGLAIAYLNTRYPALSHTFIEREVRAARAAGVRIETFTIRPPTAKDCIGDAHTRAAKETTCLFSNIPQLIWGQVRQIVRRPLGWLRAVVAGQKLSPPGVRARLSHVAYAFEATRLVEEMDKRKLRHVHVHMANNGAAVAMLACKMDPRLTYSLSIHGSAEFFHVKNWTLQPKAEGALFVRCISDFCKAQVMCWTSPTAWERYHIVHCGIDPAAFTPKQHQDGGPLRIVTVGRMIAIKGYPVLLEACSRLSSQGLDWELTMIGDGDMRKDLEGLAASMGLADRVKFPGPVSQEDMPAQLERADVMVISSFMEGIPVVLMEAMAKQLAVVATMVGGIPELITDGETGLLVPPASAEALATALSRLARDRELLRRLGEAAREKIVNEFDMASIGHEMRLLFETYGLVGSVDVAKQATAAPDEPRFLAGEVAMKPAVFGTPSPAPEPTAHQSPGKRYALITPCRDEAQYARRTLDSIVNQTVRPSLWLVVDDGSTDETPAILAEYAAKYDFIKVVRREDRGKRSVGPGVVDAFYHGYDTINPDDFDYVCKLDLDLDIPHGYFEELMRRMETYPRIGTCSGKPYFRGPGGQMISEKCGNEMSVGMIKFYRTTCFREIGGFVREVMWDGIDCHRCRMLGWVAVSWDDPELRFEHLRPMGSSQKGIFTGRMRHGFGQYFMGTGLTYMTASAIFRMAHPPLVLGGLAMWWGYVKSTLARKKRYSDIEFRRFLRRYQWACLFYGKFAATMRLNTRQEAVWRAKAQVARNAAAAQIADTLLRSTPVLPADQHSDLPPVGLSPSLLVDLPTKGVPPVGETAPLLPPGGMTGDDDRVHIGGIPIDNVTMDEAIARIESLIRAGRPSYVVTPNVDHIVKLQTQAPFREAYREASLVLADGMPLLWAARFLRTPLKQKVSGSDLFPRFCEVAAGRGYRLFFLGGRPGAAERAAELLRSRHTGIQVKTYCPSMGFEKDDVENREIVRRIRDFRADVVFVGLGAPKQEQWIHRWYQEYAAPVSIGVGASLDFVAGYVRRAPIVMQQTGFEWAWRLMAEPRRMYRRYLIEDPKFVGIVFRQKRTPRQSHAQPAQSLRETGANQLGRLTASSHDAG